MKLTMKKAKIRGKKSNRRPWGIIPILIPTSQQTIIKLLVLRAHLYSHVFMENARKMGGFSHTLFSILLFLFYFFCNSQSCWITKQRVKRPDEHGWEEPIYTKREPPAHIELFKAQNLNKLVRAKYPNNSAIPVLLYSLMQ